MRQSGRRKSSAPARPQRSSRPDAIRPAFSSTRELYSPMFHLTVEREFCAAHAIWINGELEPVHGHNWRVRCTVQGDTLDSNGLLLDFHRLERDLDSIIVSFHNRPLNETPPFDDLNPTAEHVAQYIGQAIATCLTKPVSLHSLSVTEAPGCVATYLP